ncbi:signal-transducing adaptor protein 1 isoform X2 [Bombina bombina]|uniref:signal-transducing adaptor protein 1 isoform X2 n=1 Tax=Bombina bombina TaxID=8345 RepID=UPI00235A8EB5|nr:signal-transducing adaptor protein 1 isoform X2 [Bombina bombina]
MATPIPAPRKIYKQRSLITSLPLYYEGLIWITRDKHQERKYWAELRGTTIFLYIDKKEEKYIDVIELQSLVSVADRYPVQKQWAEVVLTLEKEEVYLKTETAEDAEEWKGFILTVVELSVPNCLALLPGQLMRLKEVLQKETNRKATTMVPVPSPPEVECDSYEEVIQMPLCYHNVTRQEATDMLMKMSKFGNLILRPGADPRNFAVSLREPSESMSQVKHYKVLSTDKGYTIELDSPVTLKNLDQVVEYFFKETKGKLTPFIKEDPVRKTDSEKSKGPLKILFNILPHQRKENTYVNVCSERRNT